MFHLKRYTFDIKIQMYTTIVEEHSTKIKGTIPVSFESQTKKVICLKDLDEDHNVNVNPEFKSDHTLSPIPYVDLDENQTARVYISGVSGSGKSTLCRDLALNLAKRLPKPESKNPNYRQIVYFLKSIAQAPDPCWKGYGDGKLVYVGLEETDLSQFTLDTLKNKILIFDDFEALSKQRLMPVINLIKDVLQNGRKKHIHTFVITHQSQMYALSKPIIAECNSFVTFPFTNRNAVKKFAESYFDLDKKTIELMISNSMRKYDFLLFYKSYPRYYQSRKMIKLIA